MSQVGAEGKRFRPTMLLLMASSLSSVMPSADYLTVDDRPPNVHPAEVSQQSPLGPCFLHHSPLWPPWHLFQLKSECACTSTGGLCTCSRRILANHWLQIDAWQHLLLRAALV